jgi:hypothetical protein
VNIHNKSQITPLKINNKYVVIKYDKQIPNSFTLCFEGESSYLCPKLYIYNSNSKYLFGEYYEYRNSFKDLSHLQIEYKIYCFMLEKTTNVNKINFNAKEKKY